MRVVFTSMIVTCETENGVAMAASIVDLTLYVVNNHNALHTSGSSIVLYLPKIQTAEEAVLWNEMLNARGSPPP